MPPSSAYHRPLVTHEEFAKLSRRVRQRMEGQSHIAAAVNNPVAQQAFKEFDEAFLKKELEDFAEWENIRASQPPEPLPDLQPPPIQSSVYPLQCALAGGGTHAASSTARGSSVDLLCVTPPCRSHVHPAEMQTGAGSMAPERPVLTPPANASAFAAPLPAECARGRHSGAVLPSPRVHTSSQNQEDHLSKVRTLVFKMS